MYTPMQRAALRFVPGWFGFGGAAGALILVLALSGCPGTLDPTLAKEASGGGGSSGGTGGTNATGGTGGTVPSECTGGNEGSMIVTANCAYFGCHASGPGSADSSGGLDLTIDANVGARLVGQPAGTAAEASMCTGMGPYLVAN